MGDQTGIQWTEATWNPIVGCSRVSEGCRNCYAERTAYRLAAMGQTRYDSVVKGTHPAWTGEVRFVAEALALPLRWRRPRRIFVNSMSDLFHERVEVEWIARIFNVMADARSQGHTFQILTKRAERMHRVMTDELPDHVGHYWCGDTPLSVAMEVGAWPLDNVWLGVSVEDQMNLDRLALLRQTPAVVRFVSFEPLLEDLDVIDLTGIDWAIIGGESGPGARPFRFGWARRLVKQCRAAGVTPFFKQAGAHVLARYYSDYWRARYEAEGRDWPDPVDWDIRAGQPPLSSLVRLRLRDRKGGDPAEWPEDLRRVREYPRTT